MLVRKFQEDIAVGGYTIPAKASYCIELISVPEKVDLDGSPEYISCRSKGPLLPRFLYVPFLR